MGEAARGQILDLRQLLLDDNRLMPCLGDDEAEEEQEGDGSAVRNVESKGTSEW